MLSTLRYQPRVGVIINCPQKYLFHDPCDANITSQIAVSELVNYDKDNVLPLAVPLEK